MWRLLSSTSILIIDLIASRLEVKDCVLCFDKGYSQIGRIWELLRENSSLSRFKN